LIEHADVSGAIDRKAARTWTEPSLLVAHNVFFLSLYGGHSKMKVFLGEIPLKIIINSGLRILAICPGWCKR